MKKKSKLSLLKLSKQEESKILGGNCGFKCSSAGCATCTGPGVAYAWSSGYSYNRANDVIQA